MGLLNKLVKMITITDENKKGKEKLKVPAHVMVFDPQKPPFETLHLCIYLRELEEEKEHK
jgi:hypothetical protein